MNNPKQCFLHLEHVLPEEFLVILPQSLEDNLAELWEVDEAIPGDLVGQVNDLLLHRVQAEHLHGGVKVLRKGVSDKDGS